MIRVEIWQYLFCILHSFLANCRYFEEDDEAESSSLEYIPAPGSPTGKPSLTQQDSDDDEDPLDAYMAGIEKQVRFPVSTHKYLLGIEWYKVDCNRLKKKRLE